MKGKRVLLRNGDVLTIDGISDDENYYSCTYTTELGKKISKIKVSKESCVESDKEGIDYESLPKHLREGKESPNYDIIKIDSLPGNVDLTDHGGIWVVVKKFDNEMKVVKKTNKSIHFIDDSGKKRYTAFKNVKEIRNYSQSKELPKEKPKKKYKKKNRKK
ncbi:MAG: hypothetical protein ACOCRK_00050 [bacterium]